MHIARDLPFLWSFLESNANPPNIIQVPRRYEHVKTVVQETAFLPENISRNPTSSEVYQFFLSRMNAPKIIRENPNRDWIKIKKKSALQVLEIISSVNMVCDSTWESVNQ